MTSGGGKGRKGLLLLVLVGLVGGGGAWNYWRNLERERAMPRPFRPYSDEEVEAMEAAYRAEVKNYSRLWNAARQQRVTTSDQGLVGEKAAQFEAVQRVGARVRALKRGLADRQATLEGLDRELAFREAERDRIAMFLKRLLTF